MRKTALVTVLIAALLASVSSATAAEIGANDDTGKYLDDGGEGLYGDMSSLGLRQVVLTTRYIPSDPLTIQDKGHLDRTIPAAVAAGLRVVLAVYPYPPREVEAGMATPDAFGAYVGSVARAFPDVRQFVIGNEPNQPAFWRPQFTRDGANASAAGFGPYLAAGYDALKAVDPAIAVVGVGLSPRGNDRPEAKSNVSTSPVRFLRALGAWYRASGRTRPLMDGFSFHPYPNKATDPLDRGYAWPNAGFVNLDRIKQALWDAFNGTPQPTTVEGLKLHLDEVGWQVDTSGRQGYVGLENVVVTDELTQAAVYADLIGRAACDADVAEVSFFGFRDDGARTGFQAALQRLDGTSRPAAEAVRSAIASAASGCRGTPAAWQPVEDVLEPSAALRSSTDWSMAVRLRTGEDARATVCFTQKAVVSGVVRSAARPLAARCRSVALTGLRPLDVPFVSPQGARGQVKVAVELVAEANPARRSALVVRSGGSARKP
jgi:hypothetical protein